MMLRTLIALATMRVTTVAVGQPSDNELSVAYCLGALSENSTAYAPYRSNRERRFATDQKRQLDRARAYLIAKGWGDETTGKMATGSVARSISLGRDDAAICRESLDRCRNKCPPEPACASTNHCYGPNTLSGFLTQEPF